MYQSVFGATAALLVLWSLSKFFHAVFWKSRTTRLRGPPDGNILLGCMRILHEADDAGALFSLWASRYGQAYEIKSFLNSRRLVLCDPKAIAHFYARDTWQYSNTPAARFFMGRFFGRGLLWSEGERHRIQRKALAPAFSTSAIRNLAPIFFDSAHKVKAIWDGVIESNPNAEAIIDVQTWMNYISLDSIGIAGFSHDFGSINGHRSAVAAAFDALGQGTPSVANRLMTVISLSFPVLFRLPTRRNTLLSQLNDTMNAIAVELLERSRQEDYVATGKGSNAVSKSVIELLIKAESGNSLTPEEVQAQMNVILLAGYETTSIAITWALIELSKQPSIQAKLRQELLQLSGRDPTWEQMANGLPYLDAVVHETLRLHPPLGATIRVASDNDVIPLSKPIEAPSGVADRILVAKGTTVVVPIHAVNRSAELWGEDAERFVPERWLDEACLVGSKDVQGYRHLLTFVDGTRKCLGQGFALVEFKAVLSVLIRNYKFQFPDGPDTKIGKQLLILLRPKVVGQEGTKVPLRVSRVEHLV